MLGCHAAHTRQKCQRLFCKPRQKWQKCGRHFPLRRPPPCCPDPMPARMLALLGGFIDAALLPSPDALAGPERDHCSTLLHPPAKGMPCFLACPPASSSAVLGRDEERSKQLRWPSSMYGRLVAAHFPTPTTYCNQPRYDLCPPFHFLLLLATTLYTAHHFLVCATLFMCSPIV